MKLIGNNTVTIADPKIDITAKLEKAKIAATVLAGLLSDYSTYKEFTDANEMPAEDIAVIMAENILELCGVTPE